MVLISALARTLSIEAFSTFKIFPRMGRIAWYWRFRPIFADPPAESPSTMKISHLDGSRLSQLASFPLLSKENLDFDSILVLAFSSAFRIFADFSAQAMMDFRTSRFRSKKSCSSSPQMENTAFVASALASFVFVWPSKMGSGCFTATTAVIPFLVSAPVKFVSFSLRIPSSLAYVLIRFVNRVLKPTRWVPPSWVKMLLQKPRTFSSKASTNWKAASTSIFSTVPLKYTGSWTASFPPFSSLT